MAIIEEGSGGGGEKEKKNTTTQADGGSGSSGGEGGDETGSSVSSTAAAVGAAAAATTTTATTTAAQQHENENENNNEEEGKIAAAVGSASATASTATVATTNVVTSGIEQLELGWTKFGDTTTASTSGDGDGQQHHSPPPPMPVRYPLDVAPDLLDDIIDGDGVIMVVGTAGQKITRIGSNFSQIVMDRIMNSSEDSSTNTKVRAVKQLILRSHLIRKMEGLELLLSSSNFDTLELYDNQIDALECLQQEGNSLKTLDMSYNVIRDMQPVEYCPNLKYLYLANNKLKSMSGLSNLNQLEKIDLGANRIRTMDPAQLSGLTNLEELWLGKNKITRIDGLSQLKKLRILDIQSNRITQIENLHSQNTTLEELYLANNGISSQTLHASTTITTTEEGGETDNNDTSTCGGGLEMEFPKLNVLDLSKNRITTTRPLSHLLQQSLEELWLSSNEITNWDTDVVPLGIGGSSSLETIYLEYNPIQSNEPLYRKKLLELLPSLTQIDANMVQRPPPPQPPPPPTKPKANGGGGGGDSSAAAAAAAASTAVSTSPPAITEEERLRRLQAQAVDRAKAETEVTKKKDQQQS